MKIIKFILSFFALFFSLFPYITFYNFGTYTQPYALVCAVLFFLFNPLEKIDKSFYVFFWMLFYGIILFFVAIIYDKNSSSLKYLIAHITPFFIIYATNFLYKSHFSVLKNLVFFSSLTWLFVSFIQLFLDPAFMTFLVGQWGSASSVVLESGRGTISLSPEPTTFGFHMVILSSLYYLVNNKLNISLSLLSSSLFLAKSSSSLLVILLSIIQFIRFRLLSTYIFYIPLFCIVFLFIFFFFDIFISNSDLRLFDLIGLFLNNPSLIFLDASVNARLGGVIAAFYSVYYELLIPFGLSYSDWQVYRSFLHNQLVFLDEISNAGFPSGYLVMFFQGGFLFLPIVFHFFYNFVKIRKYPRFVALIIMSSFLVPLFQFTFAVPTFWVFWYLFVITNKKLNL